jgi:hypothetical protein
MFKMRMQYIAAIIFSLIVCVSVAHGQPISSCEARAYGAIGDGVADDRVAIQTALDACLVVHLEPGRFMVTQAPAPAAYYSIRIEAGRFLIGSGKALTTIIQAPDTAISVRILQVVGADALIEDMTLDGNKTNQTIAPLDEHRAGIFMTGASRTTVRRVAARNFTGDGFYIHIGSNDVVMEDVEARFNIRNGLSFGGGTKGGSITASVFADNGAQQLDSEPGPGMVVDNVIITGSTFDVGAVNNYAITMSGSGTSWRSRGWIISGNVINGAVFAVWTDASTIASNVSTNSTSKPCYTIYRKSVGVSIIGNECSQEQSKVNQAVVYIAGTSSTNMPEAIVVADNVFRSFSQAKAFGVHATGVISLHIFDNVIQGPNLAATGYAGVYVRATILDAAVRAVIVERNRIYGWGDAAFRLAGNTVGGSSAKVYLVRLIGNFISAGPQQRAFVIDTNAVPRVIVKSNNACDIASCIDTN